MRISRLPVWLPLVAVALIGCSNIFGQPTPIPTPTVPPQIQCVRFLRDLNFPDLPHETHVHMNQIFTKGWEIVNECPSGLKNLKAVRVSGNFGPTEFSVQDMFSGEVID